MNKTLVKNLNILKIINIFGYFLNKIFKPEKNLFKPISVDIEPTIFCNLNCKFCHSKDLVREKKNMNLDEFKRILDNFPLTLKVNIQGMGEPLLNKDIVAMIKYAKRQGKFVTVTTNGMLLDKEMAVRLIASGLDRLLVSLDSADKEAYEAVRIGASFSKVVENISNFVKERGEKRSPEVIIWMLGLKETIIGLPQMVALADQLRVDGLVLQNRITGWGKEEWFKKSKELEIDPEGEQIKEVFKRAEKEARENKVNFSINNRYTIFKKDKKEKCNWPWGGAYIASDGSVVPCCLIADPKVCRLGNVLQEEFQSIWNNQNYRVLRRAIRKNKAPVYCQKCYQ